MTSVSLDGKVVFVTGGARGIGLDSAQRMHAAGARIVLADVDGNLADREAQALGTNALGLACDVTDRAQLDGAVERALAAFGRLDVVMANAGVAPPVETARVGSEAAFDRVLDINLHGTVNTVRATLPALVESRGYLLIVSSMYAIMNGALSTPYAMSKAAVEMFGRSLRVELAGVGVDVGVAYFGFIDTKLTQDTSLRPGIAELSSSVPKFVVAPVRVGVAGRAVAAGVAARAPRITAPGWVRPMLPLRGLLQYLDGQMFRDRKVRKAIEASERATQA